MKRLVSVGMGAALVLAAANLYAENLLPGQIDFGNFSPPDGGGEFVEVNVGPSLISLAARLVEKEDPDTAKLLNGIKLVRVNVIGLDDNNREELEKRVQKVREQLDGKGWERLVTAKQNNQDVGVFLKSDPKEGVQGLAVVVLDGKREAVFVNVVGNIKPEQLSTLGEKLHLDPLKEVERSMHQRSAKLDKPQDGAKAEQE